jgi:nucleoid-associated protein YgaU
MMSTEDAAAMARNADRSLGALQNPDVMPSPADGGMPFGPGNGADDMLQQGYGTETPLVPKNSDYIPPVHGQAEAGPPGDLGASDGGLLNWDPSAIDPPDPAVMPSPAEGGMPFGPGNGANDILQQQLRPPTNWPPDLSALGDLSPMGAPPMGPPPPAQMGAPPPPTPPIPDMGAPPPPLPDQGGGLTAEDLVPPDPNSAGAAPPPPDPTGAGDLGALPGDPTAPPDPMMAGASGAPGPGAMPLPPPDPGPGGMPPPPPDAGPDAMPPPSPDAGPGAPPMPPTPPPLPPTDDDTTVAGDLGTLDPSLRAPDEMGQAPNSKRRRDQPYDFPNNDMPLPPMRPELGDLTGSTPPSDAGGSSQRMIKKGDTLWAIAEQEYGDPRLWPLIAKANPGIKDPNLIHYGKTLTIPAI